MEFKVEDAVFDTEEEAMELARAAGFTAMAVDIEGTKSDDHWHDFDAQVYVIGGSVRLTLPETGETCELSAGSVMAAPSGLVHREDTAGYRAVIGFGCDPATLTMPIDKPPELLDK